MPTSTKISGTGTKTRHGSIRRDEDVGLCIACGHRITLCGIGFTADIECHNCHAINMFRESKQPVASGGIATNG